MYPSFQIHEPFINQFCYIHKCICIYIYMYLYRYINTYCSAYISFKKRFEIMLFFSLSFSVSHIFISSCQIDHMNISQIRLRLTEFPKITSFILYMSLICTFLIRRNLDLSVLTQILNISN